MKPISLKSIVRALDNSHLSDKEILSYIQEMFEREHKVEVKKLEKKAKNANWPDERRIRELCHLDRHFNWPYNEPKVKEELELAKRVYLRANPDG